MSKIKDVLEVLGGVRSLENPNMRQAGMLGFWWFLLFVAVVCFSGQNIKFIYIDF
jgi:hypothetical protein